MKLASAKSSKAYNHTANQNKASNEVAYKQWIESHTPDEIYTANNARKLLKRKVPGSVYPSLQDARIPKRPVQAHLFFGADKQASGDFKGLKPTEAVSLSAKEWASLSPSERKVRTDSSCSLPTKLTLSSHMRIEPARIGSDTSKNIRLCSIAILNSSDDPRRHHDSHLYNWTTNSDFFL